MGLLLLLVRGNCRGFLSFNNFIMALALSLPSFVGPAEKLLKENEHLLKGNLP